MAAWTWAIDAAASGVSSNHANSSLERAAEVDLDDRADVGERLGRHLVAQQLELGDQLVGEQALAAGDDLAELDVGRAEPLERGAQPPGDAGA